jgi:hypothetical protein
MSELKLLQKELNAFKNETYHKLKIHEKNISLLKNQLLSNNSALSEQLIKNNAILYNLLTKQTKIRPKHRKNKSSSSSSSNSTILSLKSIPEIPLDDIQQNNQNTHTHIEQNIDEINNDETIVHKDLEPSKLLTINRLMTII